MTHVMSSMFYILNGFTPYDVTESVAGSIDLVHRTGTIFSDGNFYFIGEEPILYIVWSVRLAT